MFDWHWHWQFIASDNVVLVRNIGVWKLMSYMLYISIFQVDRNLWNLSPGSCLCPRGVSPSLIIMLPRDGKCSSNEYLVTEWLLIAQCFLWLWVTLLRSFWHRRLVGCSLSSGTSLMVMLWYRQYSRYLHRLTVFFTATIYRDIPWPWRYWYRQVSIDDKYRGIAGIAQH